ncbi:MAG: arginine--tRNA ligase [Candidatus Latescibacteria bacterium]|nr:arginine--tRNA ligase [Candidatus Latescibacterota bacterium]
MTNEPVSTHDTSRLTVRDYLTQGLRTAVAALYGSDRASEPVPLEAPTNPDHGDLSTSLALSLARQVKQSPRALAETIVRALAFDPDRVSEVWVAGPGFINFRLGPQWLNETLLEIEAADERYGACEAGQGQRVQVEFVSANPTGPLAVSHGRQAVIGDAISRLFEWTGSVVTREYYFNNAGRQMTLLTESVYARYMELLGRPYPFPEDGYEGDYIRDIAQTIVDQHGGTLVGAAERGELAVFKETAERLMFEHIKGTLARLGIVFDVFYNESDLYETGRVAAVIETFKQRGAAYEKDGALWFKATDFGLPQDRVIVKSATGEPTYRLPDIAYHQHKFERGFDLIVDIFGADHHATYQEVIAGLNALGCETSKLKVLIHQFVTLMKDGEQVRMSKRKANFVTLDELLDEVGPDVVRFFFLMRNMHSHLNFDLNVAKAQSDENPVYYVQYAHARIMSILHHAEEQGIVRLPAARVDLSLLRAPEEVALIKLLGRLPEIILSAATLFEPHRMTTYVREVAATFHPFYHRHRVVTDDRALTQSRLALVNATRIVLRNGLSVIGVSAPETM